MNAHATSSGIIELKKDSNEFSGFYVEADLYQSNYSLSNTSVSRSDPAETLKMMISISNNKSMVATKCFSFTPYDCAKYGCSPLDNPFELDNPSFVALTNTAGGEIYLDETYWSLTSKILYVATSCHTDDSTTDASIGAGRAGVLGLGTGDGGELNYKSTRRFSVYIKPDLSEGKILFNNDTSYAGSSEALVTFIANSTWQVKIEKGKFEVNGYSFDIDGLGNLMFDINSDAIGLLQPYLTLLINNFALPLGIRCNDDDYRPFCYYTNPSKKVKDLPDITLWVNNANISIPWTVYASPVNSSAFYLNFRGLGTHSSGHAYVNPAFFGSVILDANFMSYYYTVFDGTLPGYNAIYLYPTGKYSPESDNTAKWIIAGVFVILIGLGIYCYTSQKKKKQATDGGNNGQEPPVYNYTAYNNTQQ